MFLDFVRFELRYWFRGWMVYIYLLVMTVLFFAAASSDNVRVGAALGNTFRNAPYVIQLYYAMASIIGAVMITAFIDSASSRDFACKSSELIFSKPISKTSYLFGRLTGAAMTAVVPFLGISLGIILAKYMWWVDPVRWGPISWHAHLQSILIFAIPNTIIIGTVVFILAVLTRSSLFSFIGTLLFMVGYTIAAGQLSNLENQEMAAMLDPLGIAAFELVSKYWTVEDKNQQVVMLSGLLLYNRILWLAISGLVVAFGYWRFTFSDTARLSRRARNLKAQESAKRVVKPLAEINVKPTFDAMMPWRQFLSFARSDFRGILRSSVFIVLLFAGMLNMIPSVWLDMAQMYGVSTHPVTYAQVEAIRGSLVIFLLAIITFFAGVLVWRDREARSNEVMDALPYPTATSFFAKFVALVTIIAFVLGLAIVVGISAQSLRGYHRYQLDVYVKELLVLDLIKMTFLAVLALLMHMIAPNKYVGYSLFVGVFVLNIFLWNLLRIDTLLVKFGRMPGYTYSDMYGFKPFASGLSWFALYWLSASGVLIWLSILIAHRGIPASIWARVKAGFSHLSFTQLSLLAIPLSCWIVIGGWLTYNTMFVNKLVGSVKTEQRQAAYEKKYKSLDLIPQPRVTKIKYAIDILPETRNIVMKGDQEIVNKSNAPIDKLYVSCDPNFETTLTIEGTKLVEDDKELSFRTYAFEPPMLPREKRSMSFTLKSNTRGIENTVSNLTIVPNGTFFNNQIGPQIGYESNREISNPNRRKDYGLPPSELFPPLTREHNASSMLHYVSRDSDWVDVETTISTSSDQIAVAPGSLIKQWDQDGRKYFQYKLDHPSLNFYSFVSAQFAVERSKWNDVDLEVYYHPEHQWNVPRMMDSMKQSLEYYSKNFGPYKHKQARIIEFPRVAMFAQAFAGTMPYSEGIGFVAKLTDPEEIDMVFYIVAHEMAHQWWAHQVIGSKMQGATLLSETMAQYSALMVMEKRYGRDMMRKFLKYEMDNYLRSRGTETREERPLMTVDPDQGYIHYRKGSAVLYYLREMIGEDKVNAALRTMIDKFAYKEPPYPNAHDLIDALRAQTPAELQYLIKDLFEDITTFSNRTEKVTYAKLPNGKYKVTMQIECEKWKSDGKGKSESVPLNDWIEIGGFAQPEPGKLIGKLLVRKKVLIKEKKSTHELEVDHVPHLMGVDPLCLLVERMLDDNLKRAELVSP